MKTNNFKVEGILIALVTPFKEDNKTINKSAMEKVIDLHLEQGQTDSTFWAEEEKGLFCQESRGKKCVKWSSNNLFEMMKLKNMTNGEMNIINGPVELLLSRLASGADAGIGSTYNVMLPYFVKIYKLVKSGEIQKATKVQERVNNVISVMLPSVKI